MATKKYVCTVCGYVHEGNEPPAVCPKCGAPAEKFKLLEEEGGKKKGINTNSNGYTVVYATIVVVIVAFLLAFVSSSLKSKQTENIELDKKKQILHALNIQEIKDAAAEYSKYVKADEILNSKGEVIAPEGGFKVANGDITPDNLPIYVCDVNGAVKYVIPVFGKGLWGGIWGYIGLNEDKNTIYGTYFSHESETPGLGAEIATLNFQKRFIDKKLMKDGNVALTVKKGKLDDEAYQVNGISGGTITSNGVDAMIKKCLGNYKAFLSQVDSVAPEVVDTLNVQPNAKEE